MALDRSAIVLPELPREEVDVPELGGAVIVRGLLLRQRMEFFSALREAEDRYVMLAKLLHMTVVGSDDKPLLSEAEWERFGGVHFAAAVALFNAAERLSGLNPEDAAKN